MQFTHLCLVVLLCLAVACSRPPDAQLMNKSVRPKDDVHLVAQPTAEPIQPSEPMKIGGDVTAPRLISRAKTPWPYDPNQCYQLGVAAFEGVVDKQGNVRELRLIKGPDNEFTRASLEQMTQQKFEPATYRGKPVDVTYHVTINHFPVKRVKGPC